MMDADVSGTYTGEFMGKFRHGHGTMTNRLGVYEGLWFNNQRSGVGIMTFVDGRVYHGDWFRDQLTGYGQMRYPDGSVYHGMWLMGQPHGTGRMDDQTGSFTGSWQNGRKHGYGQFCYKDGSSFKGFWRDDLWSGRGIYTDADKNVFTGEWVAPRGHIAYADGTVYVGPWWNGIPAEKTPTTLT